MASAPLIIRPPSIYGKKPPEYVPPTHDWMKGTWHITHSSLPLWKGKRNVTITYELLPSSNGVVKVDDLVKSQAIDSDKVKSVHGVDTPSSGNPGAYDWRGKGWLSIATSHWECLGWGNLEDGNQWMVTYFAKTLFTPAGIDIYSRHKDGLPKATIDQIRDTLLNIDEEDLKKLASSIFEIPCN